MTATDPVDRYLVVSGPERVVSVDVHEDGLIESVSVRPVLVFDKQPDGSLIELFGEEKHQALAEFWASVQTFNAEQEGQC